MPTHTPPPEDGGKDAKNADKHKWRGKIFASERLFGRSVEDQESNEEDVAHFLGNSPPRQEGKLQRATSPPRIDIQSASRWPARDAITPPLAPENIYHRGKPKQNKGLQVGFVDTPPEIIGEGGDEADTPSILVSRKRFDEADLPLYRQLSPQKRFSTSRGMLSEGNVFDTDAHYRQRRSLISDASVLLEGAKDHIPASNLDVNPAALGNQGHNQADQSSSITTALLDFQDSRLDDGLALTDPRQPSPSPKTASPLNPAVQGNSPTLHTSPESSAHTPDATSLTTSYKQGNVDHRLSPHSYEGNSPQSLGHEQPFNAASADGKPLSLRNVAKSLGLNALDEFEIRVKRFSDIFRIGVAVHEDPMEIPFRRWIYVAKWWFLKGRGELENAVRLRPRSVNDDHSKSQTEPSSELKQAYIDLAKAWWIVKEITPFHPEIRRYGNASLNLMVAIVQNFGRQDLATCLQGHMDIVASLRALAMSMKRNDRMPPDTLTVEKLDMVILLNNPGLPEDALMALSPAFNGSTSGLLDLSLPLGDTGKHFTFSRTFGTGTIKWRSKAWDMLSVPCAISLLRAKDSLDLTAMVSSQDNCIEIAIMPEKSHDKQLTWREVNWSTTGSCIGFTINHDITLSLQLSESDFKTIWNICDYMRKVQKDFQGRKGERVSFEAKLYDFQCLRSARHASSFPPDPVRNCEARLFTKSKAFSDGTNRILNGHRLMIRTPPDIKSLSSISQDYGDDMPTLFGFSRRGDRPRLVVKLPGSSTFILAFESWEDLDLFYNVFTLRQPSDGELRSASLPLDSLQIYTKDPALHNKSVHVPHIRWQHVKVISPKSFDSLHISNEVHSQDLRVIAQCDAGILTDCLTLGKFWIMNVTNDVSRLTPKAPGEMQLALAVDNYNEIRILRPPQKDIFMSLTDYGLSDETINAWRAMLWAVGRSFVVKSYQFRSISGQHIQLLNSSHIVSTDT